MKRAVISILIATAACLCASGQQRDTIPLVTTATPAAVEDTLADPPTIADLPNEFLKLDTVPAPKKYYSRHMIGARYFYGLTTVSANPTIGEKNVGQAVNFGLVYTYYHALWDHINIFGLQVGANYCHVGYNSQYPDWGEKITEVQLYMGMQIHINIKQHGRILINAGPYYGYKLQTDKAGGFDELDIRHDYGVYAGGGFGLVFGRFEAHLEANYQFSFCSLYHTNKYSDLYWLTAYPRNLYAGVTLYYNLW